MLTRANNECTIHSKRKMTLTPSGVLFSSLAYGQTIFKDVTLKQVFNTNSRFMKECLEAAPVFLILIRMDLRTSLLQVARTTIDFI